MIRVLFFARFREMLDCESEQIAYSSETDTLEKIRQKLAGRGGVWEDVFSAEQRLMAAINQDMADMKTPVSDGDEVAFFPPVTGG